MRTALIWAFALAGSVGALSLAAAFLVLPSQVRSTILPALIGYATGTLLGAAFLGLLPEAIARASTNAVLATALAGPPAAYWCAAAAVIGHMFPVFRHFRGGKGVATGSGALLVVQPILAPLAVGLWWIVTRVTGKAALGSVIAVAFVPIGIIIMDQPRWELIAVAGVCALILLKHTSNIKRMIRREEHSLSQN